MASILTDEKTVAEFAEARVFERYGESVLGENVRDYTQVHLAVAHLGNPQDYKDDARQRLARLAIMNQCELAVDASYRQDNGRRAILVATGLRRKDLSVQTIAEIHERVLLDWMRTAEPKLRTFAQEGISHLPSEVFFRRLGVDASDYHTRFIRGSSKTRYNHFYLNDAEGSLVQEAVKGWCSYVTNMDYVLHNPGTGAVRIEATGWYLKSHNLKF